MFFACCAISLHLPGNYEHGILFYIPVCHCREEKKEEENHRRTDCVYVSFLASFLCYQALESAEPAWHVEVEILQGSSYH